MGYFAIYAYSVPGAMQPILPYVIINESCFQDYWDFFCYLNPALSLFHGEHYFSSLIMPSYIASPKLSHPSHLDLMDNLSKYMKDHYFQEFRQHELLKPVLPNISIPMDLVYEVDCLVGALIEATKYPDRSSLSLLPC